MLTITTHAVCIRDRHPIGSLGYGWNWTLVLLLYYELRHEKGKTGRVLLFVRSIGSLFRFARRLCYLRIRPPNGQYPYSILVGFHSDTVRNQMECKNHKSKPSCVQSEEHNTKDEGFLGSHTNRFNSSFFLRLSQQRRCCCT